jgi:hypothetical protein
MSVLTFNQRLVRTHVRTGSECDAGRRVFEYRRTGIRGPLVVASVDAHCQGWPLAATVLFGSDDEPGCL